MLIMLTAGLLLGSVAVLIVKKNQESLLLAATCFSLMLFLMGIMIVIAKRGGVTAEVERFLYFSRDLRIWLQYRLITLDQTGYLLALGRHLFPLFLLELAMTYSMAAPVRKHPWVRRLASLPAVLTLVLYFPRLYRWLVEIAPWSQAALYCFSWVWVIGYVLLALGLLAHELRSITISFCRRQFLAVALCPAALSALYLLYSGQDPGQIYRFYSYDYFWIKGLGYLQYSLTVPGYVFLVAVNVICGAVGLVSLAHYTRDSFSSDREDLALERKFDVARTGASVFVHSIKNQLLANRVLYKRIRTELAKDPPDPARLEACIDALSQGNELLISRSEELYRTVKSKSVRLVPVELGRLEEITLDRFRHKYPEGRVEVRLDRAVQVLADENYLSEALYNLLTNGWEATLEAGREDPVELWSHQERLYTVLEVRDRGAGIPPKELKHIFEPFYSGKSSSFNWGMGLYHVRTIVRSHLGSIRVERRTGGGTAFLILLPRYGVQRGGKGGGAA